MKKKMMLFCLFFTCKLSAFIYVPFDVSMQQKQFQEVINEGDTKRWTNVEGKELYAFFKNLFEQLNPTQLKKSTQLKIPKKIHQIWLGKEVPKEFDELRQSWQKKHPGWEYKLWRDKDLRTFGMYNAEYFKKTGSPAERADIWRYEILYKHGGVYGDMDFECLQSLEELHYLYNFYIGILPLDTKFVHLANGLFACSPGHPIVKHCIENLGAAWSNKDYAGKMTIRSGPFHMTRAFIACANKYGIKDIAFPAHYFYPLTCKMNLNQQEIEAKKQEWIAAGSYGIHHWAKTWLMPSFRPKQFQSIKNY